MTIFSIQEAVEFVRSWSTPDVSRVQRRRMLLIAAEAHRSNEAFTKSQGLLTEASLSASIAEYLESEAGLLDVARAS